MSNFVYVFIGGGLGAVCRYAMISAIGARFGMHFPFATLAVNAVSCFFMGLVMGLLLPLAQRLHLMPESLRLLVSVGFLGGFSTLAAFSLETLTLLRGGSTVLAGLNIVSTTMVSLVTVYLGWQLAALCQR
jgi:CrcB protein